MLLLISVIFGAGALALYKWWKSGPPSPFSSPDSIPSSRPLVTDQKLRDKVLKQGFKADKVPENLDAIVIGSGAGGLSAAAILSKAGKKVLVLEQHDQAGGCCHTFIDGGFEFDVGIHYVGKCVQNSEFAAYLEQLTEGQLQWAPLEEEFDHVILGPSESYKRFPIHSSNEATRKALVEQFPDESAAIDEFIDFVKNVRKQSLFMTLPKVLPIWLSKILIKTGLLHKITSFFKMSEESVEHLMHRFTKNPDLRAVLSYCFGDYGVVPSKAPATMHGMLWGHFTQGAAYPYGGASEIAFHMIPVIEKSGGKVLVRAPVSEILLDNRGKAYGVRVDKGGGKVDITAPLVISAAGIPATFTKFLPRSVAEKSRIWKHISKVDTGAAGLQLFVGLKGSDKELGLKARNNWIFGGAEQEKEIEQYLSMSREEMLETQLPLLFVSFPSAKDPSWPTRYPGKSACTVVTFTNYKWFQDWEEGRVKHRGDDYEGMKAELAHLIWKQVVGYFPQLDGKEEFLELGSPLANNFYLGSQRGQIYGLDHSIARFEPECVMDFRPKTDIPNLYLSGQDVMGCGFSGAMYGGLLCASEVLGRNLFLDIFSLKKDRDRLSKSL